VTLDLCKLAVDSLAALGVASAAALLLGACTVDNVVASRSAAGDAATGCALAVLGDACQSNADCCSASCDPQRRVCVAAGGCDPVAARCTSGATCCSGRCARDGQGGSRCAAARAGCAANGQACATAADCCSLGCSGGSCTAALCRVANEPCSTAADCCSNVCKDSRCVAGGKCLTAGEDCRSGGDAACCTRVCLGASDGRLRCIAGGVCRVEGEVCSEHAQCCNAQCRAGHCAVLTECAVVGEACTSSEQCCSRACADDGTGFRSCHHLGGCLPAGELCRGDVQCCNQAAVGTGVCRIENAALGIGHCQNPGGCAPAGEICEPGTNECCPGNPEGMSRCQPSALGVKRCRHAPPPNCIADEAPCAFGDQCCNKVCAPRSPSGALVCSPGCLAQGEDCASNTDCCHGTCDPGVRRCAKAPATCAALGASCAVNTDCCSGACAASVCTPPIT